MEDEIFALDSEHVWNGLAQLKGAFGKQSLKSKIAEALGDGPQAVEVASETVQEVGLYHSIN